MPTSTPPTPLFPPRSLCPETHQNCSHLSAARAREKEAIGSDGLVFGLDGGSQQKPCERARSARPHSRRRGTEGRSRGPDPRREGGLAGAAPSLPDSHGAHARRGPVSGDPRERGRGEPPAPRTPDGAARLGRARAREPRDSAAVLGGEGARRARSRPLPRPGWPSGLPAGVGFPPAACRDTARHPAACSPPYPDTAPLALARPGERVPLQPQTPVLRATASTSTSTLRRVSN